MSERPASNQHSPLMSYLTHHLRVFIGSLGSITRNPMATFMTSAVIAISLALPAGLYLALQNISGISSDWDSSAQISLYLTPEADINAAGKLASRLRLFNEIDNVDIIDKEAGLTQFRQVSGFGDALEFLDENPLPIVLTVQPILDPAQPHRVNILVKQLQKEPLVELAQLDMQWVKRLFALIEIAHRGIWIIGALLGLAVLLIVGNTIRLDIENRRDEIVVAKLIGASDAFIRRPFLYSGLWYGILGGVLAWLLTVIAFSLLHTPVRKLALLYQSDFALSGLGFTDTLILLGISCMLGLFGSWLAVGRHLAKIEPS